MTLFSFIHCFTFLFFVIRRAHSLGNVTTTRVIIDGIPYSKTEVILQAERATKNFIIQDGMFLPSDLITMLPNKAEFYIQITQGHISDRKETNLYPLLLKRYSLRDLVTDYPQGYFFYTKNFSPFDDVVNFKDYFDIFAFTFKLTLTPLLDRANYIVVGEDKFLIANKKKICGEHIDAIKETLSPQKRALFDQYLDYDAFTKSDYHSISYFVRVTEGYVEYAFEFLSRMVPDKNYRIEKDLKNDKIEKFPILDKIRSERYLTGTHFNFENFKYTHKIEFNEFDHDTPGFIHNKTHKLEVVEFIPSSILNPLYSSLSVSLYYHSNLIANLTIEDMAKYFNISIKDNTELQHPEIPFTYEPKKNTQMNILYQGGLKPFTQMVINFELRKTMQNFESIDNDEEFGFTFPSGLILFGNNFTITNTIFYNMPNIDVTMPFNLISVTWVVFGFMFVQILNIFLGKKQGGILQTLKERFLAKWGFLLGN